MKKGRQSDQQFVPCQGRPTSFSEYRLIYEHDVFHTNTHNTSPIIVMIKHPDILKHLPHSHSHNPTYCWHYDKLPNCHYLD